MSMWVLQATSSETTGADEIPLTFRLGAGAIKTIGRAPRADFVVDRALVSRLHCRLTAGDDKLEVQDLSSTNGTYVNGDKVTESALVVGDLIRVGESRVEVRAT